MRNLSAEEFENIPTLECNPDNCRVCAPAFSCPPSVDFEEEDTEPFIPNFTIEDLEHDGKEIGGEA